MINYQFVCLAAPQGLNSFQKGFKPSSKQINLPHLLNFASWSLMRALNTPGLVLLTMPHLVSSSNSGFTVRNMTRVAQGTSFTIIFDERFLL